MIDFKPLSGYPSNYVKQCPPRVVWIAGIIISVVLAIYMDWHEGRDKTTDRPAKLPSEPLVLSPQHHVKKPETTSQLSRETRASTSDAPPLADELKQVLMRLSDMKHPEDHTLRELLADLARFPEGQQVLAQLFHDAQTSEALYKVLLDTNVHNPDLLANLILYPDGSEDPDTTLRLLNLIAGLESPATATREHPELFGYVREQANSANDEVRTRALEQLAWLATDGPALLEIADLYMSQTDSALRAEWLERLVAEPDSAQLAYPEIRQRVSELAQGAYTHTLDDDETRFAKRLARILVVSSP